MIKVNLLEQARREPASSAGPSISFEGMGNLPNIATIILILVTLGWTGYKYFDLTRSKEKLDTQISEAEIELKKVEEDIRVANELEAKRARVQQQIDLIIELKENQQVPVTATAAALNVTIVNPKLAGFATVWPCSVTRPLASNLNFTAGQVVANNVVAPVGNDGTVCLYTNVPADVIVDIAGWFSSSGTGSFVGTTPERKVDTRDGTGHAPH